MPEVPYPQACHISVAGLRRDLLRVAFLGLGLLAVTATMLGAAQSVGASLRWLLLAFSCWIVVLWQCRRRLHLNINVHLAEAVPYRTLGLSNQITLARGLLIAGTAGFIAVTLEGSNPALLYVPAGFYTAAVIGDFLDGFMARRLQRETQLGAELDTALDALGLLVAPVLAVMQGKLHLTYLLVSMAYYVFQWGIDRRQRRDRPVYPLPPSKMRRVLAGLQMALVACALWPFVPASASLLMGGVLMLPLLWGFWRDWLHVSGRLVGPEGSAA